eukprot:UN4579
MSIPKAGCVAKSPACGHDVSGGPTRRAGAGVHKCPEHPSRVHKAGDWGCTSVLNIHAKSTRQETDIPAARSEGPEASRCHYASGDKDSPPGNSRAPHGIGTQGHPTERGCHFPRDIDWQGIFSGRLFNVVVPAGAALSLPTCCTRFSSPAAAYAYGSPST